MSALAGFASPSDWEGGVLSSTSDVGSYTVGRRRRRSLAVVWAEETSKEEEERPKDGGGGGEGDSFRSGAAAAVSGCRRLLYNYTRAVLS